MIDLPNILKARILIVDDQQADISLMEQALRRGGFVSVSSTMNPHEVCELQRKNCYALILLDLQMPELDGFQVIEGLKAIETEGYLSLLVLSAFPGHRMRALKAGAKDFVGKPLDLQEVLIRVQNLLEVRLLHREAALRTAKAEAANEGLRSFSYSVSHDLRAPLRQVRGFTKLLQESAGASLSGDSLEYLTAVSHAAEEMDHLIDDLLNFARLGQIEIAKTEVDLDQLVRETVAEFAEETKGRRITWEIHPLPAVQADRALLRLALINLISNAVKFTSKCTEARIEIGSTDGREETVIFVRDNGAGFDPTQAGRLFGVFQRLHSQEEFEGTGIGLANVQRIIQHHGGRTWAEGSVGGGATFYFSISE